MSSIFSEQSKFIIENIRSSGGDARFVGGSVRDFLLNRSINDIDLATTLLPEKIIAIFRNLKVNVVPTGISHGTVTVFLENQSFEITTLRKDLKCDGRHAEIQFTNEWYSDASRRDFTFNAMYMDLEGTVYDFFNGKEHLLKGEIKFIGDASSRITEDYLRIIRAFRFHADICKVPLSKEFLTICKKHSNSINKLSGERIRSEFFKILSLKNAYVATYNMFLCNVLQNIMPFNLNYECLNSELVYKFDPLLKIIFICLPLSDVDKIYLYLKNRLALSKKEMNRFRALHRIGFVLLESEKDIRVLLSKVGRNLYADVINLSIAGKFLRQSVEFYMEALHKYNDIFPVSGNDIKDMGYNGKEVGQKLDFLREKWYTSGCKVEKKELLGIMNAQK